MIKYKYLLFVLSLALILQFISSMGHAQKSEIQTGKSNNSVDSLLIKNVYLISREDTLGDIKVNVLIINSTLQIVTRDDVSFGLSVKSFDGNNGFLMGNVVIGQSPSFVILDENPRENFDIFLNTGKHIRFAMEKGVIVINELKNVPLSSQQEKQRRLTWRAYQPPPMAVPINYYNSRKWNKFNTKIISGLFNGIIALDRLQFEQFALA